MTDAELEEIASHARAETTSAAQLCFDLGKLTAEVFRLRRENLQLSMDWFALSKKEEHWENVREAALEEAAKVAEAHAGFSAGVAPEIAKAIRALKEEA